ncbi:MAG: flagellar basal body rod protein FlgB [Pseudomonadota bacterium]
MLSDLPIFAALKTKMRWHEARQTVLAQNIANADTPGYGAQDLRPVSFRNLLPEDSGVRRVTLAATSTGHMTSLGPVDPLRAREIDSFEITPEGNAVVLEEEMMKTAENQMDHQMATTLYQRGLGLLRNALGR